MGKYAQDRRAGVALATELIDGVILQTHRGRYVVDTADGELFCMKAKKLGPAAVVPGDKVKVFRGSDLGRIEQVDERSTVFRRTSDDGDAREKIIAANCSHVAAIVSTINPNPQPDFIRRVFDSAKFDGLKPLIFWTKTDLEPIPEIFKELNVQQFDSHVQFDQLKEFLNAKTTVFVGLSGAGKSTLINKLAPNADRKVGGVSSNGDGKHTSTSSCAIRLENAMIIDTPGIRSFGLGHML